MTSLGAMSEDHEAISGRVVIVGGGVAGLEALIALRTLVGTHVAVTLVSQDDWLVDRPLTVAEPFGFGSAARHPLPEIAAEFDADFVHATVTAVAAAEHRVSCAGGPNLAFDTLILAPGARTRPPFADAIVFGAAGSSRAVKDMLSRLRSGEVRSAAFVAPSKTGWLLPLYELALMTGRELARSKVEGAQLRLVTPEDRPLTLFGDEGSESVGRQLAAAGVEFVGATRATVRGGDVALGATGESVAVDCVVTLPLLSGPALPGVPATQPDDFIPVDEYGRVDGLDDVYAAGDAVDFPVKQGGLAAQQADAVAAHVAARLALASTQRRSGPCCGECCSRGASRGSCAPAYQAPTQTSPAPGTRSGGRRRRSPVAISRHTCWSAVQWRSSAIPARALSTSTSR